MPRAARLSEQEAAHNTPESRCSGPGRAEGAMLAIRAPLPPTTNNLYFVGQRRLVLSSAGKNYKEHVGWLTREAMRVPGSWPIQPPYAVSVHFYLENRRRRDVDGSSKVLIDGIFAALGVDDSLISDLDLHKRYDKANPRADVVVRAASAPLLLPDK